MPFRSISVFLALTCLVGLTSGCVTAAKLGLANWYDGPYARDGVQVGQAAPETIVYSLSGEPRELASLWSDKPTLLMGASLTCPIARERMDELEAIAARHAARLNTAVIYVYEPHPKGDPAPFTGFEWVTLNNYFSGILHRQPRNLRDRLALAAKLDQRAGSAVPIWVDNMDNGTWHAMGGGPNTALVIVPQGIVVEKQAWFDADDMNEFLDRLFDSDGQG